MKKYLAFTIGIFASLILSCGGDDGGNKENDDKLAITELMLSQATSGTLEENETDNYSFSPESGTTYLILIKYSGSELGFDLCDRAECKNTKAPIERDTLEAPVADDKLYRFTAASSDSVYMTLLASGGNVKYEISILNDDGSLVPKGTGSTGGTGGSTRTTVSQNISAPSFATIDHISLFTIPAATTDTYVDFTTNSGKGYGVYLSNISSEVSMTSGYNGNGTFVQTGASSATISETDVRMGFKASTADHLIRMGNLKQVASNFDVLVREAAMGGANAAAALAIPLNTITWVGTMTGFTDFAFKADGTTATVTLNNLTSGVEVQVLSEDGNTSIFAKTTNGTETDTQKAVTVTGLSAATNYTLRLTSLATAGASIGTLQIK